MKRRLLLQAILVGALSAVPLLYVNVHLPQAPAFVAVHFNSHGAATRWAPREVLWAAAWWPALAFIVFTWFPQARGATWFWRNSQQRQVRALTVAVLTVVVMAFVYAGIRFGKEPANPLPTTARR
jgi:hypothetical protein